MLLFLFCKHGNSVESCAFCTAEGDAYYLGRKHSDEKLQKENGELRRLLERYRDETPLGHQPYMIAHLVDKILGREKFGG